MKKSPQLPKIIKIGYQDIAIKSWDAEDNQQGCYLAEKGEIRISKTLEGRELLNTLVHECLHGLIYCYGLKKDFKNDDEEERLVNALGNGLTEILARNPEVLEFIRNIV